MEHSSGKKAYNYIVKKMKGQEKKDYKGKGRPWIRRLTRPSKFPTNTKPSTARRQLESREMKEYQ